MRVAAGGTSPSAAEIADAEAREWDEALDAVRMVLPRHSTAELRVMLDDAAGDVERALAQALAAS